MQGCNAHVVRVDLHLRSAHKLDKNGQEYEVGLLRIVTIDLSFSEHPGANSSEYVVIYLLHLCSMIDTVMKLHW